MHFLVSSVLRNLSLKSNTAIVGQWGLRNSSGGHKHILLGCKSSCRSFPFNRSIMTEGRILRTALIQLAVGPDKNTNLKNAEKLIGEAAEAGAKLVCLPECFNSPYGVDYFREYAENIPSGPTSTLMSQLAQRFNVYLVAGSIPEIEEGTSKIYNTCTVYHPQSGEIIGRHRKVHLFDIDVPGKITFQESKVLSPGENLTVVRTDYCNIGIGICYDIRFPEMAQLYRQKGCEILVYPGAFNMTTGPAHWELLQRSRALDNQLYVATISPARDETASYTAWGHSMVVDPWGKVMTEAQESQTIVYADIDLSYSEQVRKQIPVSVQKRPDLYEIVDKIGDQVPK